jgi:hypothetical protein
MVRMVRYIVLLYVQHFFFRMMLEITDNKYHMTSNTIGPSGLQYHSIHKSEELEMPYIDLFSYIVHIESVVKAVA